MPVNAGGAIQGDMLSGIEEESDIYEAFAPHVDYTNIPLSTESSPGELCHNAVDKANLDSAIADESLAQN